MVIDTFLSLLPFVGSEGKIVKTVVSSDAVIGKIVLSKSMSSFSDKIVTRSSFAFEQYLLEKGETEILYKGLNRISTKFGTVESAFRTLYGNTLVEQFKSLGKGYVENKVVHIIYNSFYENDMILGIQDSFDVPFLYN